MEINNKTINTLEDLLNLLKDGINPLSYINDIKDVEFISKLIIHSKNNNVPFFNDMSEILLKAIILYIISIDSETKSLKRCKEIIELEINNFSNEKKLPSLFNLLDFNHPANMYYTSIKIMPEKTYMEICKNLNQKLSAISI